MAIEIRFIFALLVSLEFVINVNELPFFSKQELLAMRRNTKGYYTVCVEIYNCLQFEKGRVTVYWLL